MCYIEDWLRTNSNIVYKSVALTTTPQMVWTADPLRHTITIANSTAGGILIGFGASNPTGVPIFFPQNTSWPSLRDQDVGELITQPIWMTIVGTGFTASLWGLSYNARKKEMYDTYINRLLTSHLGSP
jgi:hypothetical protein